MKRIVIKPSFLLLICIKPFGVLNKLENEAVLKKGKLRTFYSFKSVFHKEVYLDVV